MKDYTINRRALLERSIAGLAVASLPAWFQQQAIAAEEERLADLVDRAHEVLRSAQPEADAQPAQAVDLRERPQQDEVLVALEQVERRVRVVERVELAVGLVEDHRDDMTPCTALILDPDIVPLTGRPTRPFQGWRYLDPDAAPPDMRALGAIVGLESLPAALRLELRSLCLL